MNWRYEYEQIKADEGLRLKPYKDTMGVLTIGIGRNLESNGISLEEAEFLYLNDLRKHHAECSKHITCFSYLDDDRQGVVLNMLFNMGWSTLSRFKKFLAALDKKDYTEAALQMEDSVWYEQVGDRAKRLVERMRG